VDKFDNLVRLVTKKQNLRGGKTCFVIESDSSTSKARR